MRTTLVETEKDGDTAGFKAITTGYYSGRGFAGVLSLPEERVLIEKFF
jgi:hypothetical protein